MTRRQVLLLLLVAKLCAGFLAWNVVGRTTKLGDTQDYIAGAYVSRNDPTSTAYLMSVSGQAFAAVVGQTFLANLPLLLLAWVGLAKGCGAMEMRGKHWVFLFLVLLSPSFQLWTSIHSKEAVVSFGLCFLAWFSIRRFQHERVGLGGWVWTGAVGVLVVFFKPLYAPAVLWLLFFSVVMPSSRAPKTVSTFTAILTVLLGFVVVASIASLVDPLVRVFHLNFSIQGDFTRTDRVWNGTWDMLLQMPLGILTAFIGPSLAEASRSSSMAPFFIEGIVSLFLLAAVLVRATMSGGSVFLARLWMLGGFVLLLLAAHYPFGYFNPGSAIRYKQSFYGATFLLLFAFAYDQRLRLARVRQDL